MRKFLSLTLMVAILAIAFCLPTLPAYAIRAIRAEIGQQLALKTTNPRGVPLNEHAFPSRIGRVADGSTVTLIDADGERRWLKIDVRDGRQGWIGYQYIDKVLPSRSTPTPRSFASPQSRPIAAPNEDLSSPDTQELDSQDMDSQDMDLPDTQETDSPDLLEPNPLGSPQ